MLKDVMDKLYCIVTGYSRHDDKLLKDITRLRCKDHGGISREIFMGVDRQHVSRVIDHAFDWVKEHGHNMSYFGLCKFADEFYALRDGNKLYGKVA